MKILYITAVPLEYSSSANFRNIALIRGLMKNGHSVSTLSTRPQENSPCYDKTILDLQFEERFYVELGQLHAGRHGQPVEKKTDGQIKSVFKGRGVLPLPFSRCRTARRRPFKK